MQLNADLTKPAAIPYNSLTLDGDEVSCKATTLVRYAPNSSFNAHTHTGGEEFLVLDGIFADEHGKYPAGSYIRNKVRTRHLMMSVC
ncbi:ChrR cupin-like domain-containing protein [Chytridium lagenaria]|nr:ChrR cupin-like domain-containing protein [Chytridium lagenaria]